MAPERTRNGIATFIDEVKKISPSISSTKLYALFLRDTDPEVMYTRSISLYSMNLVWHKLMGIDL